MAIPSANVQIPASGPAFFPRRNAAPHAVRNGIQAAAVKPVAGIAMQNGGWSLDNLSRQWRVQIIRHADPSAQQARFLRPPWRRDRNQPHHRFTGPGNDDFIAGDHRLDDPRTVGLRHMDVDRSGQQRPSLAPFRTRIWSDLLESASQLVGRGLLAQLLAAAPRCHNPVSAEEALPVPASQSTRTGRGIMEAAHVRPPQVADAKVLELMNGKRWCHSLKRSSRSSRKR